MLILQDYCKAAINLFANGVPPHPSYILQTTYRMIGTETDTSDTIETLATRVILACVARQASTSTHGYLCTCVKFCSSCT